MTKIIFAVALATTSIASACKISKAGMSFNLISTVSAEAFATMPSDSSIKAIYSESTKAIDFYVVEILDANGVCSAQLYNAQFDTLNCQAKAALTPTFAPIPCK